MGTDVRVGLLLALFAAYQYIASVRPAQLHTTTAIFAAGVVPPLPDVMGASVGVREGSASAENDIIVLSANYGHLDFLINWVCTSGNVLNLKFLIIAQDEQLHAHLRDHTELPVLGGTAVGVSGPADEVPFKSEGFNRVSNMKLKAVVAVLKALL